MDTQVSPLIDHRSTAQDSLGNSNSGNLFCTDSADDLADHDTPWQEFCGSIDAWARHALASNGFGGI